MGASAFHLQLIVDGITFSGKMSVNGSDILSARMLHNSVYCILFGNNFAKQSSNNILAFCISGSKGTKCGVLPLHEASDSHEDAAMKALSFKNVYDGRLKDIHFSTSDQHDEQVKWRYCRSSFR